VRQQLNKFSGQTSRTDSGVGTEQDASAAREETAPLMISLSKQTGVEVNTRDISHSTRVQAAFVNGNYFTVVHEMWGSEKVGVQLYMPSRFTRKRVSQSHFPSSRPPCKSKSREKTTLLTRAGEERARCASQNSAVRSMASRP
jgi:hypothetical protein